MDVEATTAICQAEVGAAKTMLVRTTEQFDITPSRLVADAGYGSAEMIEWLVDERGIEPYVKVDFARLIAPRNQTYQAVEEVTRWALRTASSPLW